MLVLNRDLEEAVYFKKPEGFVIKGQENKVDKLFKSLYSLKLAPKHRHEEFKGVDFKWLYA